MAVFEKFSERADEDTMIPKYMTGGHTPGASRTSSGLSMLISNAGKGIKQVINNIDKNIIVPAVERLYHDNLRYADDPDLVGDLHISVRGASSLVVKEAEAIRRNEFLQLVLSSPVAQQIVGMDGAAELQRRGAQSKHNRDRIVPDRRTASQLQQQAMVIQQLQQQLAAMSGQMAGPPTGSTASSARKHIAGRSSPVGGRDGSNTCHQDRMVLDGHVAGAYI